MPSISKCIKYRFEGRSGGIVDSRVSKVPHDLLIIGHTAFVSPWSDPYVHLHQESEEFYLLRHGELELYIAGAFLNLQPGELLMIHPQVPHAVVGGGGQIEHFGFRAPACEDKRALGEIPSQAPNPYGRTNRELAADWGYRIPLTAPENQNCWLIGWGAARYASRHLILAYLNFPTFEAANAGIGTRLRMHYHRRSWEYYIAWKGRKILQIEDDLAHVDAGEILEVPPMVRHNIQSREAPYEGFTVRVPLMPEGDKDEDDV
jgi:mannose-6-phosphate isomerase-like protein (cupin superfamily)